MNKFFQTIKSSVEIKRIVKFGLVGVLGTTINIFFLYVFKEHLFKSFVLNIHNIDIVLNLCIALSIFISIVNNYFLNSLWTWRDRKNPEVHILFNFKKYLLASWASISIQFIGINVLTFFGVSYLFAAILTVAIGSFFNFSINHFWTFKK
jgi:dolichol-phosphate mannosyltransferase